MTKELILFTSTNFPDGGAGANYLNLFCKGVSKAGGKISVYLFKGYVYKNSQRNTGRKSSTDYGVEYTSLGLANRSKSKIGKIFEDFMSITRTFGFMFSLLLKRKRIQIFIYSNALLFNIPVYFISKLFGIEVIAFIPEYLENNEIKGMNIFEKFSIYSFLLNFKYLNKHSNKLIVFSSFLKNHYLQQGFDESNILVHPNLTDLNAWYIPDKKPAFTIGYAGTPSKKDGLIDLLYAIKLLKEKDIIVSALIVGDTFNNDSFIPYFKEKCNEFDIKEQVTFTGLVPQEKVKDYLNICKILAITRPDTIQTKAGFPTKIGEYMACKKIVLATKFGDIEQYFEARKHLVLAEQDNPSSIAENILWILNHSEKSELIATNGFEKAKEIFEYETGVKKILSFCDKNL